MLWHRELCRQSGAVEGPKLPGVQAQRLGLEGHVGDGLTEVVVGEFGVFPIGVFDVTVAEIGHEQAGAWCPGRRASGQMAGKSGVDRI